MSVHNRWRLSAVAAGLLGMALIVPAGANSAAGASPAPAKTVPVPSYVFVHDPSMTKEGHTWYLFSTGDPQGVVDGGNIQIRESTNLTSWRLTGSVFQNMPSWIGPNSEGRSRTSGRPTSPTSRALTTSITPRRPSGPTILWSRWPPARRSTRPALITTGLTRERYFRQPRQTTSMPSTPPLSPGPAGQNGLCSARFGAG